MKKSRRTMKFRNLIFILLAGVSISCCRVSTETGTQAAQGENVLQYAHNVIAVRADYGYNLDVLNPWDSTSYLGRFALVPDSLRCKLPEDRIVIRTPVKSVVSFSSTQWMVFLKLGEIGRVKCILEGRYVEDETMRSLLDSGVVTDVGTEMGQDVEKMIAVKPDVILYSPYFDGKQDELKITGAVLFPFADYLENTPLGRAEWIRVIGMLTCRETAADAWFSAMQQRYDSLKYLCEDAINRPVVFSDKAFQGQWYVAGGQSYIARLFADAGADYVWKDNTSTASFPLDGETILAKAQHADFWRMTNSMQVPLTYSQLASENPIYSLFDAFKNRKVIVCDIRRTRYFEQSQCEPDILLADFIYFFHPECMKGRWADYRPKYYYLMQE